MKILYLLADPAWHAPHRTGGYSTHVNEVVAALTRAAHSVEVYDARELRGDAPETLEDPEPDDGAAANGSVRSLPYLLPPKLRAVGRDLLYLTRNFRMQQRLDERLVRGDVDLIYERFHHMQWAGVRCARRHGVPIIVEFNAGQNEIVSHQEPGLVSLGRSVEQRILADADRIIVVSEVLRRNLIERGLPEGDIITLHNGVDHKRFDPRVDGEPVRRSLGFADHHTVIGFVGSFAPWHGVELLVEAADQVCRRVDAARFLLVGGQPGSARFREVESMVAASGLKERVRMVGRVPFDDIAEHIAAMDVATMPCTNEYGSPLKIFEYMAMERAIVAPDQPAIREILAHGKEAILVPSRAAALADAFVRLAGDEELRRVLGAGARQRALAEHSWDRHAQVVEELHQSILNSIPSRKTRS